MVIPEQHPQGPYIYEARLAIFECIFGKSRISVKHCHKRQEISNDWEKFIKYIEIQIIIVNILKYIKEILTDLKSEIGHSKIAVVDIQFSSFRNEQIS